MARVMLQNQDVARNLWGEAINSACHTVNRVYFRPGTKKTPYELWKGRKPNVKYFKIFGSTCFILKIGRMWESLIPEMMKEYFWVIPPYARLIGYTKKKTMKVMETVNVVIDESSDSYSEKGIEELTKEILPPEPREV